MNCWGNRPISPSTPRPSRRRRPVREALPRTGDERMLLQESGERTLQLTGAVSMNEADDVLIAQERFVEEALRARDRLIHGAPDDVQVCRRVVAGCSSTCTLTRGAAGATARSGADHSRSRTLARIRFPRTSRSAEPS